MAEFLTMDEAKSKFGTKGRTNAGLTLGIIGTALAAFAGNNGGCGCGNGGGILGNLFGGNNNCCAMQAAENAKTLAMAQGQQADNLSWANRVQSMQDDIDLYTYVNVSTTGTEYVQVTKFDVIHNIQYTDCKGNVRVSTESTSTIMETAATSETITTLTPTVTKVIDVIIPNGVSIVSQQVLDELPTSLPVKGHCAYSVFDVRVTPAPTAAIASVAKSK